MERCSLSADLIATVITTWKERLILLRKDWMEVIRHLKHQVVGILNGIDESIYNPKTDPALFVPYDNPEKADNKKLLQEFFGLPVRADVPILSMITRLVEQKGLDLVANVIEILQQDLQLVILEATIRFMNICSAVSPIIIR